MEVCVDNIESVLSAVQGGAKRIELCSSLVEGGLTPTVGFLRTAKNVTPDDIPIFVMIRPRGGNDFIYSQLELDIMISDIDSLKKNGADGFVFGVLTSEEGVDEVACRKLIEATENLPCTFHRAFDLVSDPHESVKTIIGLGFKRILTSGQKETALAGKELIKTLIESYNNNIIIMPGAGVTAGNVSELLEYTHATEVHGSAKKKLRSTSDNNNSLSIQPRDIWATDIDTVRAIVKILEEKQ